MRDHRYRADRKSARCRREAADAYPRPGRWRHRHRIGAGPIHLDPHTEPQPDLALLRPRADFYKTAHPRASDVLLIIEVADHSLRDDREIKIPLYARHGIPEVWLVDLLNDRLNLFRDGGPEGYRQEIETAELERLNPLHLPTVALDLRGLWQG